MSDKLSILDNGRMSQEFEYKVNVDGKDVVVRETSDLDIQNGNYGKTTAVRYKDPILGGFLGTNFISISPDSAIGKAIAADEDGARGNAFRSSMDEVSVLASKQTTRNERTHENALRESGMYDVSRGFTSHTGTEFPDNTKNKEVVIKEETDDSTPKVRKTVNADDAVDLFYPKKSISGHDYIYIEAFEYKAPQADMLTKGKVKSEEYIGQNWLASIATFENIKQRKTRSKFIPDEKQGIGNKSWIETANTGLGRGSNIGGGNVKKRMGSVRLPIPNAIKSSNGVDWGEARVNAFEAGAFMAAQDQISSVLGGKTNLAGALKSGVDGLKETFDKLPEIGGGQSGQLISSVFAKTALAQVGLNVDPSQLIARSTGMAINPNLELLFSSPKLRTFTFVFQFAPDDDDEATEVRKIQRFFKKNMLPTNSASKSKEKLYLGSPDVFRLCYKNKQKRIKGLNIFKMCALTACEINFTPENVYQAYDDPQAVSMPVRSFMTLTFTELTPIFRDDFDGNTDDPSLADLGDNILGKNKIEDDDIGF